MEINGYFTSNRTSGESIETFGTLDLDTGELNVETIEVENKLGDLISEEFVSMGGEVYKVCPNCHQYITNVDGVCFNHCEGE